MGSALARTLEAECAAIFGPDEGFNPVGDRAVQVRKIADEFLQAVKSSFPNRYFILKKIAQSAELWEVCIHHSHVILNEEAYVKKLQSCLEVSPFYTLNQSDRGQCLPLLRARRAEAVPRVRAHRVGCT